EGLDTGSGLVVLRAPRSIERERAASVIGLECLEDVLDGQAEVLAELARGGKPAELIGQLCRSGVELHRALLQRARKPYVPDVVAEVPAQLAEDGWHGVGGKGSFAPGVE